MGAAGAGDLDTAASSRTLKPVPSSGLGSAISGRQPPPLMNPGPSLVAQTPASLASMDRPLLDGSAMTGTPSTMMTTTTSGERSGRSSVSLTPITPGHAASTQLPWLEAAAAHRAWQHQQHTASDGLHIMPSAPSPLYGTSSGDADLERRLREAYREATFPGAGGAEATHGGAVSLSTPRRRPLGLYLMPEGTSPCRSEVGAGIAEITSGGGNADGSDGGRAHVHPSPDQKDLAPHRLRWPVDDAAVRVCGESPGPSGIGMPLGDSSSVATVSSSFPRPPLDPLTGPFAPAGGMSRKAPAGAPGPSVTRSARSSEYGEEFSSEPPHPVPPPLSLGTQPLPGGFPSSRPAAALMGSQPGVQPFGHGLGIGGGGHHRNPSRDAVRVTKNPLWNSDEWKGPRA